MFLTNREMEVLAAVMSLKKAPVKDIAFYSNRSGTQTYKTLLDLTKRGLIAISTDEEHNSYYHFVKDAPEGSYCPI